MARPSSDRSIWQQLRDEMRAHNPRGRLILGVEGEPGSGAAEFAARLADAIAEDGTRVFQAPIDGFRRPAADAAAPGLDATEVAAFRRDLVDPFRSADPAGFRLAAERSDGDADAPTLAHAASDDVVVIVDGAFLQRPELRGVWNWSVWLDVPLDIRYARIAAADGGDPDPAAPGNAARRRAEEHYLREARPRASASAIVDATDPNAPVRAFWDFC